MVAKQVAYRVVAVVGSVVPLAFEGNLFPFRRLLLVL